MREYKVAKGVLYIYYNKQVGQNVFHMHTQMVLLSLQCVYQMLLHCDIILYL